MEKGGRIMKCKTCCHFDEIISHVFKKERINNYACTYWCIDISPGTKGCQYHLEVEDGKVRQDM